MTDREILDHVGIFIERHESGLFGVGAVRSVFAGRRYFRTYSAAMDHAMDCAMDCASDGCAE
tara:strand:+ start:656 stop:841 length:186 start_codon:yes stop_codon:yes gene_type:complete